jgi:hypothetical protein
MVGTDNLVKDTKVPIAPEIQLRSPMDHERVCKLRRQSLFTQIWCKEIWSGRRDSNPQPSAWEADALPLRHTRSMGEKKIIKVLRRVKYWPRIHAGKR